MATIKKIVKTVPTKTVPTKAIPAKVIAPVKAVKKPDTFEVVSMEDIQLVPKGGGGGKALSPFAAKVFSLEIGQGVRISDDKYNAGKGVASLYAGAKRRNIKLRVRRDTNGQLWLFRIEMPEEVATEEYESEGEEVEE